MIMRGFLLENLVNNLDAENDEDKSAKKDIISILRDQQAIGIYKGSSYCTDD